MSILGRWIDVGSDPRYPESPELCSEKLDRDFRTVDDLLGNNKSFSECSSRREFEIGSFHHCLKPSHSSFTPFQNVSILSLESFDWFSVGSKDLGDSSSMSSVPLCFWVLSNEPRREPVLFSLDTDSSKQRCNRDSKLGQSRLWPSCITAATNTNVAPTQGLH